MFESATQTVRLSAETVRPFGPQNSLALVPKVRNVVSLIQPVLLSVLRVHMEIRLLSLSAPKAVLLSADMKTIRGSKNRPGSLPAPPKAVSLVQSALVALLRVQTEMLWVPESGTKAVKPSPDTNTPLNS